MRRAVRLQAGKGCGTESSENQGESRSTNWARVAEAAVN